MLSYYIFDISQDHNCNVLCIISSIVQFPETVLANNYEVMLFHFFNVFFNFKFHSIWLINHFRILNLQYLYWEYCADIYIYEWCIYGKKTPNVNYR